MRPPGYGLDALRGPLSTPSLDYMQGDSWGSATLLTDPPLVHSYPQCLLPFWIHPSAHSFLSSEELQFLGCTLLRERQTDRQDEVDRSE